MKVDFDNVTLRNDLYAGHLSLGQHLVEKVVPGDVAAAGIDGVQHAHDERDDEEGPQALPVHLVILLSTFLLLWKARQIVKEENTKNEREKLRSQPYCH